MKRVKIVALTLFLLLSVNHSAFAYNPYVYSFASYNYPEHFIRHQNYLGEISKISSDLDKKDATFRIVRGLAGTCNSFESVNYPGYYLRHQNYRVKLNKAENNDLFQKDATFCMRDGLADTELISFESYNYPDHYIRHKNYHLYIEKDKGDLFNKDATFKRTTPKWDN